MPTQRVQRYDANGRFVTGWFVDAKGGHFGIGLTSEGQAAVCTGRGRMLHVFALDGRPAGDPRPCFRSAPHSPAQNVPKILQPSESAKVGVALQTAHTAQNPRLSLVPALLFPLWHPFIAWALGLAGVIGLRRARTWD